MIVVLLGPPGAGKGTQAVRIAAALGLAHLSSGDILRAERKARTELGRKAQDYMDRGVLVPDDLILDMMMDRMGRPDAAAGVLLDGFPRTVAQARGLDERLTAQGRSVDRVVNMELPDEVVTRRLTGRWSCPENGRIYHEVFSPPRVPGLCDECGAKLVRRRDDEPDVVARRLRTFHEETRPLISYYNSRGVLRSVDAGGSVDGVTRLIEEVCRPR